MRKAGIRAKSEGILIARHIVQGDFTAAMNLAMMYRSPWTVTEARAICGALAYANRKWSLNYSPVDFMPCPEFI